MEEKELLFLLNKYLSNDLTPSEQEKLEDWYAARLAAGADLFHAEPSEKKQKFQKHLFHDIQNALHAPKRRLAKIRAAAAVAAICVVLAGGALLYLRQPSSRPPHAMTEARPLPSEENWVFFANTNDTVQKIALPDGSHVKLYAHSELKYKTAQYGQHTRDLYLQGKGFFDVAKDAKHPFIVHSGGLSTTALGTAFIVDAYPGQAKINIRLLHGKIRIRHEKGSLLHPFSDVILAPGQYFDLILASGLATTGSSHAIDRMDSKSKPALAVQETLPPVETGYANNYDREALNVILEDFRSAYHVAILFDKDDIKDIQFSGTILPTDSIGNILKRISLLNNLNVKKLSNGKYIVRKN